MRFPLWSLALLGTLALAGLPAPAAAQPVGSEFQVNTYTLSNQLTSFPRGLVAADASGNFVVVWMSNSDQDGSRYGIFGQRYDSTGAAQGSEFQVNSYTTGLQKYPAVAAADDGAFVVVWMSYRQDGNAWGIFGQRYDSAGGALGAEFRVNSTTLDTQRYPSVAADASGNFVVVWESGAVDGSNQDVFGQRYDSAGVAQGSEFQVNSYTTSTQKYPSVAAADDGDFVVVWMSYRQDGSGDGIFGQRYDSAGRAQGSEFQVNSYTMGYQVLPAVAATADGDFVVVWWSRPQDGSIDGVFGQRYDSEGVALGDEFSVGSGWASSVASDETGNFVVVWHRYDQDGSSAGIFGRRYDSGGEVQGDEFQINSYTTGAQKFPSVGATGSNQFVVVWESFGQDGSGYGVFGQRFDFGADTITVVSPNTNLKWRIGSLQKVQWTHNLGEDATFRIELDRDDDGDYEELIVAAAPVDSATKGSFAWTVTGPPSGTARVRVSWTDDLAVSDSSDVTFQIRPPG